MNYRRSKSSKDEGLKDSYTMSGGEGACPNTNKQEKEKVAYTREAKGNAKQREFTPRLKSFLCDGPHLARECPKRKVFNALIKEREKEEEDAHLGSIQMSSSL